jgi:acyl carrier protein
VKEQTIAGKIRQFLEGSFPLVKGVGNESSLLGGGMLDSLGILEVVTFVEREFNISIDDEELLPENFQTVKAIATFVVRKCAFRQ